MEKKEIKVVKSVTIKPSLWKSVQEAAWKRKMSASKLVSEILEKEVEK